MRSKSNLFAAAQTNVALVNKAAMEKVLDVCQDLSQSSEEEDKSEDTR